MTKPDQLRWGLLGTARINRALIEPILSSKNSTLSAVASRFDVKAAEYARIWNIPNYFTSYEALLEDPQIDVVYNSLPNSMHAEWSIKAMEYGKHVLCEKPLTTTTTDADRLISVSKLTGKVITEAFMYRHHPQTLIIKEIIDQGRIGKIQLIRGTFCFLNNRPSDIRFEPSLGGGSLWDVGCYPVSFSRYIIGNEPNEVIGQQMIGPTGVDLLFAGQMRFPGDVIAQFSCSFITPFTAEMEIIGSEGKILIPEPFKPGVNTRIIITHDEEKHLIRIKGEALYGGELRDIENAVLHGKQPLVSLEDSRDNIAALEALYLSANKGYSVKLSRKKREDNVICE
jgi:D-xylose 1-dehydrogenase (NADP+, D-xylono-1,5-lactone-forming)